MKILFCAEIRLGAFCAESLDNTQAHKWQAARSERFAELIDLAMQKHAGYLALFGSLFGQTRISESIIDGMFASVREEPGIQMLAFLSNAEYRRISYRKDIPENLHLIVTDVLRAPGSAGSDQGMSAPDSYLDDLIALRARQGTVELQLGEHDPLEIAVNEEGTYELRGIDAGAPGASDAPEPCLIPALEPAGFDEADSRVFGYGVLEWTAEDPGSYQIISGQKYAFEALEVKILPEDDENEILRKLEQAVRKLDRDTFLRLTLVGRSAFGLTINSDALRNHLQSRVFDVQVFDNTVMDIDEEAFENDISLRSEFVRLAMQDDTLSESERSRLLSCGWNALGGKVVSAE